jgi:hypothetical protein
LRWFIDLLVSHAPGETADQGWCKASFMPVESNMNVLEKVFVSIESFFSDLDAQRRDAYLAESQNVADLERRLRSLDSRPHSFW